MIVVCYGMVKREKNENKEMRCGGMEECFWKHNHTQKPIAQVKTSTTAMINGEIASIVATDNGVLWLMELLLTTLLLLVGVSLSLDDLL